MGQFAAGVVTLESILDTCVWLYSLGKDCVCVC